MKSIQRLLDQKLVPTLVFREVFFCFWLVLPSKEKYIDRKYPIPTTYYISLRPRCLWLQGHQLQCMIPFWIRLLTRMNQIWVLSEWVQFDEISTLLKILNPRQRREGTSRMHYICVRRGRKKLPNWFFSLLRRYYTERYPRSMKPSAVEFSFKTTLNITNH